MAAMTAIREVIGYIKRLSQAELILRVVLVLMELRKSLILFLFDVHLKLI